MKKIYILLLLLFCPIEFHFFFFLGSVYIKEYYLCDSDLLSIVQKRKGSQKVVPEI